MSAKDRWFVFADDAGDPGANGAAHFGYAALGITVEHFDLLVEQRARFRTERKVFHEPKRGNVHSLLFREVIGGVRSLVIDGHAHAAASFITKERYAGAWLHERDGVPSDTTMLRNYMIRKTLELLFADVEIPKTATMELVLDRVDYNDTQVANLRDYLAGKFANYGAFGFPRITHATHADSKYVEGLQVADHLARLAHRIAKYPGEADAHGAIEFLRMETVVRGRPVEVAPEAVKAFSRGTRRKN